MGKGTFEELVQARSAVICAKTGEPIEMPFGIWTGVPKKAHITWGAQ